MLGRIAEVWARAVVIPSWLLDLHRADFAQKKNPQLERAIRDLLRIPAEASGPQRRDRRGGPGRKCSPAAFRTLSLAQCITPFAKRFSLLSSMRNGFVGHNEPQPHADPGAARMRPTS